MAGAFEIQEGLPGRVYSGDDLRWHGPAALEDYPTGDHSVECQFRHPSSDATETVTATIEDSLFVFEMPDNMATGNWLYAYQVTENASSRSIMVGAGQLHVQPLPTSEDGLTHAKRTLDAIEKEIEARVSGDGSGHVEYQIASRSIKKFELEELYRLRTKYKAEVNAEQRLACGGSQIKKTLVKF